MLIGNLITEIIPDMGIVKTQIVKYSNGLVVKRIYLPKFSLKVPFDVIILAK